MPQAFGHNAWIGFGSESTYGTRVAPTLFLEILSENFKREKTFISKPALRSASQKNKVRSKRNVTGGFKFQFSWEGAAATLLRHALGTVNTTGAGPFTHTITPAGNLPTGLTFHVNRDADNLGGSNAWEYEGCNIQKITLSQEIEDFLNCEVEVLGEDSRNLAKATPSFTAFDGIDWEQLTVARIDVAGTPINPNVKSLELMIENSLAEDRYKLGSDLRTGLGRSAHRKITGSFELELDTTGKAAYDKYRDLVDEDLQIKWVNGAKSLTIDMPKCSFDGGDPETGGPGQYYVTLNFTAYANAADNDEISIVLVNSTSAI